MLAFIRVSERVQCIMGNVGYSVLGAYLLKSWDILASEVLNLDHSVLFFLKFAISCDNFTEVQFLICSGYQRVQVSFF